MKKYCVILFTVIWLLTINCFGQQNLDKPLSKELQHTLYFTPFFVPTIGIYKQKTKNTQLGLNVTPIGLLGPNHMIIETDEGPYWGFYYINFFGVGVGGKTRIAYELSFAYNLKYELGFFIPNHEGSHVETTSLFATDLMLLLNDQKNRFFIGPKVTLGYLFNNSDELSRSRVLILPYLFFTLGYNIPN